MNRIVRQASNPIPDIDHHATNEGPRVRTLIEHAGGPLFLLPPHSPDFNAIEAAWNKPKTLLRGLGARTKEALETALTPVLDVVTTADTEGWLGHCGCARSG